MKNEVDYIISNTTDITILEELNSFETEQNQLGNKKNPVFHKQLKHFQKFIRHWFWPKIVVRINVIQVITLTSNPFRRFV